MEKTRKSSLGWITPVLIGLVIGVALGLYIGWVAWPVKWKDATPAILDANSRQLFLRAAIDSYMVNQDTTLAKERYDSLGDYSASTLSAIYSNPLNQTSQAVQAFANAVGAGAVLQAPPGVPPGATQPVIAQPATEQPASGVTTPVTPGKATPAPASSGVFAALRGLFLPGLLACFALLIGLGLVLFLFNRSRNRTRAARAPEPDFQPLETSTQPQAAGPSATDDLTADMLSDRTTLRLDETPTTDQATPGELPDWLQEAAVSQPQPTEQPEAVSLANLTAAEATANDIPDWLQEAPAAAPASELPDWLNEETPAAPAVWEPQETSEQTRAKFSQNLADLPAMEPEFARRLRSAGVSMPMMLLKKGATPESRLKLAEKAGVDAAELTTWVNVVDLFRVRGLNTEHALLLDGIGIRGVSDLAAADPAHLTAELDRINQEANLLAQSPDQAEVSHWIGQAQALPPAVN